MKHPDPVCRSASPVNMRHLPPVSRFADFIYAHVAPISRASGSPKSTRTSRPGRAILVSEVQHQSLRRNRSVSEIPPCKTAQLGGSIDVGGGSMASTVAGQTRSPRHGGTHPWWTRWWDRELGDVGPAGLIARAVNAVRGPPPEPDSVETDRFAPTPKVIAAVTLNHHQELEVLVHVSLNSGAVSATNAPFVPVNPFTVTSGRGGSAHGSGSESKIGRTSSGPTVSSAVVPTLTNTSPTRSVSVAPDGTQSNSATLLVGSAVHTGAEASESASGNRATRPIEGPSQMTLAFLGMPPGSPLHATGTRNIALKDASGVTGSVIEAANKSDHGVILENGRQLQSITFENVVGQRETYYHRRLQRRSSWHCWNMSGCHHLRE